MKYEECGGYDCMNPAWVIRDESGETRLVVDEKDFYDLENGDGPRKCRELAEYVFSALKRMEPGMAAPEVSKNPTFQNEVK
jgi:hypothetical protein